MVATHIQKRKVVTSAQMQPLFNTQMWQFGFESSNFATTCRTRSNKTAELADVSFIHGMRFPEVQLLCFITTWGIIIKVSVLTTP